MRKLLFSLLTLAALCGGACAQFSVLPGFPPGVFQGRGAIDGGSAPSYTGPGDTVAGASAAYSCSRAYNAAYASAQSAMCLLVDTATGLASCTLSAGTNGFANVSSTVCVGNTVSITTFCTVTHAGCSVKTMYDMSGANKCSAAACNVTQATLANTPTLAFNGLNGLPYVVCAGASAQSLSSATITSVSQPFSISSVVERTSSFTTTGSWLGDTGGNLQSYFNNTANVIGAYVGVNANTGSGAGIPDSAAHAVQTLVNATASGWYVDGGLAGSGSLNANLGTNATSGGLVLCNDAYSDPMYGNLYEALLYPIEFNSTQYGNMNTNQHSGYDF